MRDKMLSELALELRSGKIKARDLAATVIDNHHRTTGSLGAYKTWNESLLSGQAVAADSAFKAGIDCGPLQGLPVSVKDLFGVRGFPTFAGSCKQLPKKWEREGPVIQSLRRQLAIVTGKTHTVEFAFGGLGVNSHWAIPRNPWDNTVFRVPGGSSSGAGVSLCVGSAVLALGTDTAGSVRIPASMTGNVGLKTSIGRWSTEGIVPLSPSLDSVGLLARRVADVAYGYLSLESSITGRDFDISCTEGKEIAGLRFGVCKELLWDDCSPGVVESVEGALRELEKKQVRCVPISLPEVKKIDQIFRSGGFAAPELYAFLKTELTEWLDLLDEKIAQRMDDVETLSAFEYLGRVRFVAKLSQQVAERMKKVDFIVSPTVAVSPPKLEELKDAENYRRINLLSLRNTSIVNYLGLCALTMPIGTDANGMPVGLQLIGPRGCEKKLLAVAVSCENGLGSPGERLGPLSIQLL